MPHTPHHIALAGGNGLIGAALLQQLLQAPDVASVQAPTRRPLPLHARLSNPVGPLEQSIQALQAPLQTAFCCLGTTMAKARSQAGFYAVDMALVKAFSEKAQSLGAEHLLVVSAMGANAQSRFFYNRVKGEMEAMLIEQHWPHLTIARPALLLGARAETRLGESLAAPLARLLPGNYKAIDASTVARALWHLAQAPVRGTQVVESAALRRLGAA